MIFRVLFFTVTLTAAAEGSSACKVYATEESREGADLAAKARAMETAFAIVEGKKISAAPGCVEGQCGDRILVHKMRKGPYLETYQLSDDKIFISCQVSWSELDEFGVFYLEQDAESEGTYLTVRFEKNGE
ncbi:hypothetical protein WJT74_00290 [Sphingomicrobium sp. XHP0239]|uniref:hypothetical protein n=1 Tax=Sphingomicrobium maritimum TaxID=3133972 RepID=UPI0031CC67B6